MTHIRQAEFPRDAARVAALFDSYVDFLTSRAPEEVVAPILSKYPAAGRAEALAEFARVHVPPRGALLLAEEDGAEDDGEDDLGCGMMRYLQPGVAELQRIYVAEAARGRGLGRALTEALIAAARDGGARRVLLDTGGPLVEAIGLYRALGFREVAPYHDAYPELLPHLTFFELALD